MGSYFDIPGIIDVQQNYLVDLSKNYYNNPIDVAIGVNDLQKGVINISDSYGRANQSSSAVLAEQERMKEIVKTEKNRLDEKQALIIQMEQENARKTLLNETYRKKKVQYSKIMIVLIVALCIFIAITFLGRLVGFSGGFFTLLYILDISIALIICFNIYADVAIRDNINYDEIYVTPPKTDGSGNLIGTDASAQSFWSQMKFGCYEASCCAGDTVYDPKLKVCMMPPSSKPSPMAFSPSGPSPSPSGPSPSPSGPSPSLDGLFSKLPSVLGYSLQNTSPGPSAAVSRGDGPSAVSNGPSPAVSRGPSAVSNGPSADVSRGPSAMSNGPSPAVSRGPSAIASRGDGPSPAVSRGPSAAASRGDGPSATKIQQFTTLDQAIQYGDINSDFKVLSESTYNSKTMKSLNKSKDDAKPYTDLEFTTYKYKI